MVWPYLSLTLVTLPSSHPHKNFTLPISYMFHPFPENFLSISNLCHSNSISVEFFSDYFLLKDLKTGVPLFKGMHKDGLYHLPNKLQPHAFLSTISIPWHHVFGHPSSRIFHHLKSKHQIKLSTPSHASHVAAPRVISFLFQFLA